MNRIFSVAAAGMMMAGAAWGQPDSLWSRTYHGHESDVRPTVIQTADGGYLLFGTTGYRESGGQPSGIVFKTDAEGNQEWSREYKKLSEFPVMLQAFDNGFILASSYLAPIGVTQLLMKRISANGVELSSNVIDGDYVSAIQTSDDGFAILGCHRLRNPLNAALDDQLVICKTDFYGNVLWKEEYGEESREDPGALIQTYDGGFALLGARNYHGFLLMRTDENGRLLWSREYNSGFGHYDFSHTLAQTSDGGFVLFGTEDIENQTWMFVVRTDSIGNQNWSNTYGNSPGDCANIIVDDDGGFILAGTTGVDSSCADESKKYASCLISIDRTGSVLWERVYELVGNSGCSRVIKTADGGFALVGTTQREDWETTFVLIKTGPE